MKDRIREIRKERGESMQKFSEFLGISKSNLESYELGRRNPSDAVIGLICNKCAINETWLRSGEGDKKAPLGREAEIAQMIAKIYNSDPNSISYKLHKLIAQMDDEQLEVIGDIAVKLAESMQN